MSECLVSAVAKTQLEIPIPLVSVCFPVFTLQIRETTPETSSLSIPPTAIESSGAETFPTQLDRLPEIHAIPRGFGG